MLKMQLFIVPLASEFLTNDIMLQKNIQCRVIRRLFHSFGKFCQLQIRDFSKN